MDSRDQEKFAANLLREGLSSGSGNTCPDSEILAAYFDRSLDASETAHFELHLSQCPICRQQLQAMHRANEATTVDPARSRGPSRWGGIWNWRRLAPVAAALMLAGIWIARRPTSKSASERYPLVVAMSQPQNAPAPAPTASRDYLESGSASPRAIPEKEEKQDSRKFSTADKLSVEKSQPALAQNKRALKDEESDVASRDRNAIGGLALKKQNEASAAPAVSPMAKPAGAPMEAAQKANIESAAKSIGPQPGAAETQNNQTPERERVSAELLPPKAQSKALAVQAVERRSSMRVLRTPDPNVLWRIAEGGFVERSTDGGTAWKGELPSVNAQLTAGFAPSAEICWVVGRNGAIFLTTNASDWQRIQSPVKADFAAITAQDAFSATVTTADGHKFVTTDSGAHWNPVQ